MGSYDKKRIKWEKYATALLCLLVLWSCKFFGRKNADHPGILKPLIQEAELRLKTSPSSAIPYLNTAFRKIRDPGPGDQAAKYDFQRRYYLEQQRDLAAALLYTDSALSVLQPHAGEKAYYLPYAEALFNKGDILFKQKRFNESYLAYYNCKVSLQPLRDTCAYAPFLFRFYSRLGDISYGKSRFLDAVGWHKRAIAVLEGCTGDPNDVIPGSLNNIALCYDFAGKLDSAIYFYEKDLQLLNNEHPQDSLQKRRIESTKAVIIGNQGSVCVEQGKLALAEEKFRQNIAINSRKGYDNMDARVTRLKLADLYEKTGRLKEARTLLVQIDAAPDSLYEPQDRLMLKKVRAAYASGTGEPAKGYKLLLDYVTSLNALRKSNRNLMSTDFSREFEMLTRDFELQDLKKQNELKNLYLVVTIVVCMMSVAIIYLILKSNRQARTSARQSAEHNKQLEITLAALEKSNLENTQLLNVVAHDLKNPISAIYGISSILMEESGLKAEDKEMLELIRVSSKNLDLIIHDLLTERVNKVQGDSNRAETDLHELLKESVSLLQYRAGEKKQHIALSNGGTCLVNINKDRVWRVINNLIVNAIKFSPRHTTIDVSWKVNGDQAMVCVRDQGIGIPDELKDKIFDLSTEAKRQGTAGEETFGLGLYISKQIVEEQGGKIWLESVPGKGSSFYFSLPLA